ncbi:MAG: hypothetical protein JO021_04010 [Alphaproteobacteria bacterium]|nr:hypothetical protein [Alphaproteobacteria bacterium]
MMNTAKHERSCTSRARLAADPAAVMGSASRPAARPIGRPRAITEEVAAELCRRIASGRTLRSVSKDVDMPHVDTVYEEMNRSIAFSQAIADAREESAHGLAMSVVDIADEALDPTSPLESSVEE